MRERVAEQATCAGRAGARARASQLRLRPLPPVATVLDAQRNYALRPVSCRRAVSMAKPPNWLLGLRPGSVRRWPEQVEWVLHHDGERVDREMYDAPMMEEHLVRAVEAAVARVANFEDDVIVKAKRQQEATDESNRQQTYSAPG